MRTAWALAALAALVVLTACNDGGDQASTTTTAASPTTSTASAAPTTGPGPTTTITSPPACPQVEVPPGATSVSTGTGDFDGDGAADELRAYLDAGTWHLQVELAAGGGDDVTVTPVGPAGVEAVGGHDVDEDGDDEAWAKVGSGASTQILGLFAFDACSIDDVTLDGSPARFPVGASVSNAVGVECAGAGSGDVDLTAFEGSSQNGTDFMVESTLLHLDGTSLTVLATDVFGAAVDSGVFEFDCGSLAL